MDYCTNSNTCKGCYVGHTCPVCGKPGSKPPPYKATPRLMYRLQEVMVVAKYFDAETHERIPASQIFDKETIDRLR